MTKNLSLIRRSNNRVRPSGKSGKLDTPEVRNEVKFDDGHLAKVYVSELNNDDQWTPTVATVFKLLVSLRISAGIWSIINDCDEVYNYWEPLHLFLYGSGFQTWEYSPVYAIRSYLYIWLHWLPLVLFQTLMPHTKVTTFFFLRCWLAFVSALADLYLYKAVGTLVTATHTHLHSLTSSVPISGSRLGHGIGRLFAVFSIFSTAMFVSSPALLPSSFAMIAHSVSLAAFLEQRRFLAVLATVTATLIGWPFAALIGLPIALEMVIIYPRQLALRFFLYCSTCLVFLCTVLFCFDSHLYGRPVLAPLNIVLYNVLSSHDGGPSLYGVEPIGFYLRNLLLNWNVVLPLAMLSPASILLALSLIGSLHWHRLLPLMCPFATICVWMLVFLVQPHKEERFLAPIHPLMALFGAVGLDGLHRCACSIRPRLSRLWNCLTVAMVLLFVALSLSRNAALHRNYHAPMDCYVALSDTLDKLDEQSNWTSPDLKFCASIPKTLVLAAAVAANQLSPVQVVVFVCVGKEWHRFPGSFFLSHRLSSNITVQLAFVKSHFTGLLPKPFESSSFPRTTRHIPTEMNDRNLEEPSRYMPIEKCDFLVDLETPDASDLEPNFASRTDQWLSIHRQQFLLARFSHPFFRAFYLPGISHRFTRFGWYHVLQRIR